MQILEADSPLLISIIDMDHLKINSDSLSNKVIHMPSGNRPDITQRQGHNFIQRTLLLSSLFTKQYIYILLEWSGHLYADRPYIMLNKKVYLNLKDGTCKILQRIVLRSSLCNVYTKASKSSNNSLHDYKQPQSSFYAHVYYINFRTVLDEVDASRHCFVLRSFINCFNWSIL